MLTIRQAKSREDLAAAHTLLREYAGYLNDSLGEEHIDMSSYEWELAELPDRYAAPDGAILLAFVAEAPVGCVALKRLELKRAPGSGESACEMKRLWVKPEARSRSIGRRLTEALIVLAKDRGYTAMYLDTVPAAMQSANGIYRELGFEPVRRYGTNPILGVNPAVAVEFFRLAL